MASTRPSRPNVAQAGAGAAEGRPPEDDSSALRSLLFEEDLEAETFREHVRRSHGDWISWVLVLLAAACFGVAYKWGNGDHWNRVEDALHLLTSGFPGHPTTRVTHEFEVAQQLAPIVVLFLSLRLVTLFFAGHINRWRARYRRGHVVVCGIDEAAYRGARAFLDAGKKVTFVAEQAPADLVSELRAHGARVLSYDPTQRSMLAAAAVGRASHVVCASPEDRDNIEIAASAADLARRRRPGEEPLTILTKIEDAALAQVIRSSALSISNVRLQVFDLETVWAHRLVDAGPLGHEVVDDRPPQLVVIGTSGLALRLLSECGRRWHERRHGAARMRVVVVAEDAVSTCARLTARYPALAHCCELVPLDADPRDAAKLDSRALFERAPDASAALYLCLDNEPSNAALALEVRRRFGHFGPPILIPATRWMPHLSRLLRESGGGLVPVFPAASADGLDLLNDSQREAIAREVHSAYLAIAKSREDTEHSPAEVPWSELDQRYRASTRLHVDELVAQLEAIWFELEPLTDWDEQPQVLREGQVEVVAQLEHERWTRSQLAAGWRYGPTRDPTPARRWHPLLVPWSQLAEEERELDRTLVRRRPAILARAGFRLAESPDRAGLARLLHERHLASGGHLGVGGAPAWGELDPDTRALNLAAVDAIPAQLLVIGYRVVMHPTYPLLRLTDDEIERLAPLEHERWCELRRAQGWRYGARRSDARREHPDLVPWSDLPAERQTVDRWHVAEIPSLLAAVGRGAVRLVDLEAPMSATVDGNRAGGRP